MNAASEERLALHVAAAARLVDAVRQWAKVREVNVDFTKEAVIEANLALLAAWLDYQHETRAADPSPKGEP